MGFILSRTQGWLHRILAFSFLFSRGGARRVAAHKRAKAFMTI